MAAANWYYRDLLGETYGPFEPVELFEIAGNQEVEAWREGLPNWTPLDWIDELSAFRPAQRPRRIGLVLRPAEPIGPLDAHGQPRASFNHRNNLRKAVDELTGLARAMLLDGQVTEEEARYLRDWTHARRDLVAAWPMREIVSRLDEIFADGKVDQQERTDLKVMLEKIVGSDSSDDPSVAVRTATRLPLDTPAPELTFPGRRFVVTGQFVYGARSRVEAAIKDRGGTIDKAITTTLDFLTIGAIASRDWKHGSFGTKIEKAVDYRTRGAPIKIVGEEHFVRFLRSGRGL